MPDVASAPVDGVVPARVFGPPIVSAVIRNSPEDFIVVEELGFEPSGDGEHDFLHVEKTAANTAWVARQLARIAGVASKDVGYAGLKDRQAITQQWFSVRRPNRDGTAWESAAIDGVRILDVTRNSRKLRRGAHRGNRFRIALRSDDIGAASEALRARVALIGKHGVPNYYGEQRFGRGNSNLELARQMFNGKRLQRDARSLALSAARSCLFNMILAERVRTNTWNRLLAGDVANLDGSGSVFAVDKVTPELEARVAALDIHPTATLWGDGAPLTRLDAAALELGAVERCPEIARGLMRARVDAASRALRMRVKGLSIETEQGVAWLGFSLPKGAFATTVLAEIVDYASRSST